MLKIPDFVQNVIEKLNSAGFEAYIVGGCVRDLLCGRTPDDYDVTTNATPSEVKSVFSHTVDTGIKHGTVTVISEKMPVEVTTFRTEDGYADGRHPDSVKFVSDIKSDLSRRDFTVNAIAYNQKSGLIDPFGGRDDIKSKILRAVGEPEKRFFEDALRILRLFRFCCTLGFSAEEKTFCAALRTADGLKKVSDERIFAELLKAANSNNLTPLIPLIEVGALDKYKLFYNKDNLSKIKKMPSLKVGNIRLFAFLNLFCDEIADSLKSLKCSNKQKDYCIKMKAATELNLSDDKTEIKKMLNRFDDIFEDILEYRSVIDGTDIKKASALYNEIIKNKEPYKISHLKISGNELLSSGISGDKVGERLNEILEIVIKEPTLNTKQELLKLI